MMVSTEQFILSCVGFANILVHQCMINRRNALHMNIRTEKEKKKFGFYINFFCISLLIDNFYFSFTL